MIDIKALAAEYDCRREVEDVLGQPRLRTAKSLAWCCPFHDEKTPSFHVYETHYYCFGCGARGDVLDFWAWSRNIPLTDIIRQNSIQPMTHEEKQRIATQQAERAARELEEKIKEAQKALEELKKAQSWLRYHNNLTREARTLWRARGIPDEWQDYWKFGYSPSCPTYRQSPSLTIPIFTPTEKDPINIRHRLLNPECSGDKYRPEQSGLPAVPFFSDPELPIGRSERVIVVEGEIKAAVTFLTIDEPLWQVIGIPGKRIWEKIAGELEGRKDTVILLDPDAKEEAVKMARSIGGAKVADLPEKVDDMLLNYQLGKDWLKSIFRDARFVN